MNRVLVSNERLLEILNDSLHEYDQCRECQFPGALIVLRHPDPEGCNWSRDLILRCSTRASDSCQLVAKRVIDEVTKRYNLEVPSTEKHRQE